MVVEGARCPFQLLEQLAAELQLDGPVGEFLDTVDDGEAQWRDVLVGGEVAVPVAPRGDQLCRDIVGDCPGQRARHAFLIERCLWREAQSRVRVVVSGIADERIRRQEAAVISHAVFREHEVVPVRDSRREGSDREQRVRARLRVIPLVINCQICLDPVVNDVPESDTRPVDVRSSEGADLTSSQLVASRGRQGAG